MNFTRSNPSTRYQELQAMYRQLHREGEKHLGLPAEKTFNGLSLLPQLVRIKSMIERTGACTILDYGSGKGQQYALSPLVAGNESRFDDVLDFWGVDSVHCYDPAYEPYSTLPSGRFDGVISTDVLEHCPEEDIPWIIDEIFSFADRFVYANIACYPATKRLPNGENAHCTIRPSVWWEDLLREVSRRYPAVRWQIWVQTVEPHGTGQRLVERCIEG